MILKTMSSQPECRRSAAVAFHEMFQVEIARTQDRLHECQRLRFQVYCLERDWDAEVKTANGREIDAYDARSEHALLRFKPTGVAIGTVRLILPHREPAGPKLQMQELSPSPLDLLPSNIPRDRLGEISRFSVSKQFRRRAGENFYPDTGWTYSEEAIQQQLRRAFPNISVGLIRGIFIMARSNSVTHLCATMDPALLQLLKRLGIFSNPLAQYANTTA